MKGKIVWVRVSETDENSGEKVPLPEQEWDVLLKEPYDTWHYKKFVMIPLEDD